LAELQKPHVKSVLASLNWNQRRAAKILGIDLKALSGKIKTYKLSKPK
jgi:DNA-binding protein Fis